MNYATQHCCDKTMDHKMIFSQLYKIMVNKVAFGSFREAISPLDPLLAKEVVTPQISSICCRFLL